MLLPTHVLQGNVFVNQYLVIKQLGRGAHGSVKLVFDTEQQLVHAMKVRHPSTLLLCWQHRGVVHALDATDSADGAAA